MKNSKKAAKEFLRNPEVQERLKDAAMDIYKEIKKSKDKTREKVHTYLDKVAIEAQIDFLLATRELLIHRLEELKDEK